MGEDAHLRSERFEVSFNRIHQALKKLVTDEPPHFANLVHKGAKKFTLVKKYQEELHQFARLRNAIVHDRYDLGEYIAEPHEGTVQRIEQIAAAFAKPNYALSIATKRVVYYDSEDSIETMIQGINEHSYSQYPFYQQGECVGLLTARAVVKWLDANRTGSMVDLTKAKVKDVYAYEKNQAISFAPKSINIFDIEAVFEHAHSEKSKLEAIVITENGRSDEKPLGVVTPWDLIEIDYTLD